MSDGAQGTATYVGERRFLTAAHVVGLARHGKIAHGNDYWFVEVRAADYDRDLAVLTASVGPDVRPLSLTDDVSVGARVFALGYPAPFDAKAPTLTSGIVSALRDTEIGRYLQLDASINPGSSGGPVLSERGGLLGIVIATIRGSQQLNLAVSAPDIRSFLQLPVTRGLDPRLRPASDEFAEIIEELAEAARAPAMSSRMFGEGQASGFIEYRDRLLAIRRWLARTETGIRSEMGQSFLNYDRAIDAAFDALLERQGWNAAAEGRPSEVLQRLAAARGLWLAGDREARVEIRR